MFIKRQLERSRRGVRRLGFSLVEVMIASFVLGVVFLSSLGVIQQGFRMLDDARMSTIASQVLQSQMENIRLLDWDYIGGSPELDASGKWYFQTMTMTNNLKSSGNIDLLPSLTKIVGFSALNVDQKALTRFNAFTLTVEDSTVANSAAARSSGIKVITLSIGWKSPNGRQHQRAFQSYYAQNGLNDFYYTIVRP